MRIAAFGISLLLAFASCSTTATTTDSPFQPPNSIMAEEISRRVEQIPYQHRDELLENLMWLAQTGEQTIPALLQGLRHENPKVRSSSAWVLGRQRDRRTIPPLQAAMRDNEPSVQLEVARTLVAMGDLTWAPTLIEGLDSDRKEVRYMCHEALKGTTGHDFGYDHLDQSETGMRVSILQWRQWWSEYSGDPYFAQSYQQKHKITPPVAVPMGEIRSTPSEDAPSTAPPALPIDVSEATPTGPPQQNAEGNPSAATPGSAAKPMPTPIQVPAPVRPNGNQ